LSLLPNDTKHVDLPKEPNSRKASIILAIKTMGLSLAKVFPDNRDFIKITARK
jgi:hypothetical protein